MKTILFRAFFFMLLSLLLFPLNISADVHLGTAKWEKGKLLPGRNLSGEFRQKKLREIEKEKKKKAKRKKKKRRVRRIEIVRVIPLRGNNPLNTINPIRNTTINGQTIYRAPDEVEEGAVQPQVPSSFSCAPSSGTSNSYVLFYICTAENKCSVGSAVGQPCLKEAFEVTIPCRGATPAGMIFVQTSPGIGFTFTQVPPQATPTPGAQGISWYLPPGTYDFTLREDLTGKQWRVNITITATGTGDGNFAGCGPGPQNFDSVTLRVNSVTPL